MDQVHPTALDHMYCSGGKGEIIQTRNFSIGNDKNVDLDYNLTEKEAVL